LSLSSAQLKEILSIDLDIVFYKDVLTLFRDSLGRLVGKDVYLLCGVPEGSGCNGGSILATRKALPLLDAWLESSRIPAVCESRLSDQDGLGSIANKFLNTNVTNIFFLPPGSSGVCGYTGGSPWFVHYNCQDDKVISMKANHDWYYNSSTIGITIEGSVVQCNRWKRSKIWWLLVTTSGLGSVVAVLSLAIFLFRRYSCLNRRASYEIIGHVEEQAEPSVLGVSFS